MDIFVGILLFVGGALFSWVAANKTCEDDVRDIELEYRELEDHAKMLQDELKKAQKQIRELRFEEERPWLARFSDTSWGRAYSKLCTKFMN